MKLRVRFLFLSLTLAIVVQAHDFSDSELRKIAESEVFQDSGREDNLAGNQQSQDQIRSSRAATVDVSKEDLDLGRPSGLWSLGLSVSEYSPQGSIGLVSGAVFPLGELRSAPMFRFSVARKLGVRNRLSYWVGGELAGVFQTTSVNPTGSYVVDDVSVYHLGIFVGPQVEYSFNSRLFVGAGARLGRMIVAQSAETSFLNASESAWLVDFGANVRWNFYSGFFVKPEYRFWAPIGKSPLRLQNHHALLGLGVIF